MEIKIAMKTSRKQAGFTLIELVVVIVILGILAATALPRFVDLTDEAKDSALMGYVGAINGSNSINLATYLARQDGSPPTTGVTDTTGIVSGGCSLANINPLLGPGSTPLAAPYQVTAGTTAASPVLGTTTISCVLSRSDYTTSLTPAETTIVITAVQ